VETLFGRRARPPVQHATLKRLNVKLLGSYRLSLRDFSDRATREGLQVEMHIELTAYAWSRRTHLETPNVVFGLSCGPDETHMESDRRAI